MLLPALIQRSVLLWTWLRTGSAMSGELLELGEVVPRLAATSGLGPSTATLLTGGHSTSRVPYTPKKGVRARGAWLKPRCGLANHARTQ